MDATGVSGEKTEPISYISLFSMTSGNLVREVNLIGGGFICGRDRHIDFVTFFANYSCWMEKDAETGWDKSDIPIIHVDKDSKGEIRQTQISIDTRVSTRWSLGINTNEIEDFQLEGMANFFLHCVTLHKSLFHLLTT